MGLLGVRQVAAFAGAVAAVVVLLTLSGGLATGGSPLLPPHTLVPGARLPSGSSPSTGPQVVVLAALGSVVGANDQTFTLNFTVAAGASEVLVLWAIGGGLAAFGSPSLPTGLSIAANTTDPFELANAGIAAGALAPGSYSTSLTYPGWTNDVSMAVYGVMNATGATYQFGSTALGNTQPDTRLIWGSVALPSGAFVYLGGLATGGYPVYNVTMTSVAAEAPGWEGIPGYTEIIGSQEAPLIQAGTPAHSLNVVGVGIYSHPSSGPGPAASPGPGVAFWTEPYVLGPVCALAGGCAVVLLLRTRRSTPDAGKVSQLEGASGRSGDSFDLRDR